MAAMYYAFIVNPAAGTGFALTTMEKLEEILRAKNTEYRVIRTERPGHGTEIAAELAKDDEITAVVSVGGDGTAGEIAAGKQADALLVDLSVPQMQPAHNLLSNWVYAADSSAIRHVICAGRVLK